MQHPPHDPVPLHPVTAEVGAQWPPGTFLENLALDSDGESWLVTSPLNLTVYRVRADGTTQTAAKFDRWVTGIVSHPRGPLAAVGTQGRPTGDCIASPMLRHRPFVRDDNDDDIGAVGVSGHLADGDEACALRGIAAAGLRADPGA
jgi:hypothetical protein